MAKREIIYLLLVIFLIIGFFAYTSNPDTKVYSTYNHPPGIDRLEVAPPLILVGEEVRFTIAATNRTHREIYDKCGPDFDDYQSFDDLEATIRVEKGVVEIARDKPVIRQSAGSTGIFDYVWIPREPGEYRVVVELASQAPPVHWDFIHGEWIERATEEKTFSVIGN